MTCIFAIRSHILALIESKLTGILVFKNSLNLAGFGILVNINLAATGQLE